MKNLIIALGLLASLALPVASIGQEIASRQTASLAPITADVRVVYTPQDHKALVIAVFTTTDPTKYSVNCLSVYRDVKFTLRDSSGQIMQMDSDAWKSHADYSTEQYANTPCERLPQSWTKKDSRAFLQDLYPSVPHGTYSLEMLIAPHGLSHYATLAPFEVQL